MKIILAIMSLACLTACSDNSGAQRTLQQSGYTEITTTGYALFGCSDDDTYHTGFKAKGPSGVPVQGVVCGGVFKGNTIRLD